MSVAESYQQDIEANGLGLVRPEDRVSKSHVGPVETDRLMAVGTYNARILAAKVKLGALARLPFPAYENQDAELQEEIERLRTERDAMIVTGVARARSDTPVSLRLVPAPRARETSELQTPETAQPPDESLPAQIARLHEMSLAYVSLANTISRSLDQLAGEPAERTFSLLDLLSDISDEVSSANDRLTTDSDSLIDRIEHARDNDTVSDEVEPEKK